MGKNLFTVAVLLFGLLLVKVGNAQDFTALYSYTYNTMQEKSGNHPSLNGMMIYYRLITQGNQSSYYMTQADTSKYNRDGANYRNIITYLKDNRILNVDNLLPNHAKSYSLLDYKNLSPKNKSILFNGHKAILVTGTVNDEEVSIYFTPEIPTPFGPSIYSGLPGLVVRVETPKEIIQLVSFEQMKIENYPFVDTTQLTIVDEKTYDEMRTKVIFKKMRERQMKLDKD